MKINLTLLGIKFYRITDYHLSYGYDPDTGGNSLYLWNDCNHRMVRKLLKVS